LILFEELTRKPCQRHGYRSASSSFRIASGSPPDKNVVVPDFTGKANGQHMGVQPQSMKIVVPAQNVQGTVRPVAPVPHHRVSGQFGMPPDLVLSAGQRVAFDQGVVTAVGQ
jgi:hypothetical protein